MYFSMLRHYKMYATNGATIEQDGLNFIGNDRIVLDGGDDVSDVLRDGATSTIYSIYDEED